MGHETTGRYTEIPAIAGRPEITERLEGFIDHLMAWNRIHNLTGAKSREAIEEQILDSLWPLTFLPEPKSLLDIGTGAGFPGMVLAIALPQTECTLCEPLQKRAAFLRFVARELELRNVRVEAKRVEALDVRPYGLITSRAVAETATLIDWSRPFVAKGSQLLFYKGEQVVREIEGLEACDIELIARGKRNYLWIKDATTC
ncbi:16S rRNA (guanine(527)-N(7))-methyltransferase RsmG [Hydrogenimonas sp.]